MKSIFNVGVIILICVIIGCKGKLKNCQNLKVNDPKIIEFANKFAKSSRNLTTFEQPIVSEKPDYWIVSYTGKESTVGNHFGIVINRKTCKGNLIPGS